MSSPIFGVWLCFGKGLHPFFIPIKDSDCQYPNDGTSIIFISVIPYFFVFPFPLFISWLRKTGVDDLIDENTDYNAYQIENDLIPFQKL